MYKGSFSFNLGILNIEYPCVSKKVSFISALSLRWLPHLSVESISIHKLIEGIKKSIIYLSTGYWKIYLTPKESRKLINVFSWGSGFLRKFKAWVLAAFTKLSLLYEGLSFFIRALHSGLEIPYAQWFFPLFLVSLVASFKVRNFKFSFSAFLFKVSLLTPALKHKSLWEIPCSQCNFNTISLRGMLKKASNLFKAGVGRLYIYLHYNGRLQVCQ